MVIKFKSVSVLFLLTLFQGRILAQNFEWAYGILDKAQVAAVDSDNNLYFVGGVTGTKDVDPGPDEELLNGEDGSGCVIKLSPTGDYLWSFLGLQMDLPFPHPPSIALDADDNVYVWGYFKHDVELIIKDVVVELDGFWGAGYLVKLDADGNFLWAKVIDDGGYEIPMTIAVDVGGDIILTGIFDADLDADPGLGTHVLPRYSETENFESFMIKLDNEGEFIWAKNLGIPSNLDELGHSSLDTDFEANIYFAGTFEATMDFDPDLVATNLLSTVANSEAFLQKLDADGNFVWVKTFECVDEASISRITDMNIDEAGFVFLSGYFSGGVDFDFSEEVEIVSSVDGSTDGFVRKIDADAEELWTTFLQAGGEEYCYNLAINSEGETYAVGTISSVCDFNEDAPVYNLYPSDFGNGAFIWRLDEAGDFSWAQPIRGNTNVYAKSIVMDNVGDFTITGDFFGSVEFDPGNDLAVLSGPDHQYAVKYSKCEVVYSPEVDSVSECHDYYWPLSGYYYAESGLYQIALPTVDGCDSIVSLNFEFAGIDVSVTQEDSILTANLDGATYQWVYCHTGYSHIVGSVAQSEKMYVPGSYAVIVSIGGCTDTSDCFILPEFGLVEPELVGYEFYEVTPTIDNLSDSLEDSFFSELALNSDDWQEVILYPNPNQGEMTLSWPAHKEVVNVQIFSANGQIICTTNVANQSNLVLNLDIAPGLYWVEIQDKAGNMHRLKFIRE
jgi:hypothetical protein